MALLGCTGSTARQVQRPVAAGEQALPKVLGCD